MTGARHSVPDERPDASRERNCMAARHASVLPERNYGTLGRNYGTFGRNYATFGRNYVTFGRN